MAGTPPYPHRSLNEQCPFYNMCKVYLTSCHPFHGKDFEACDFFFEITEMDRQNQKEFVSYFL